MRSIFPVFDLHCDTAAELLRKGESLAENTCDYSLERAGRLLHSIQFFAFCTYGAQWRELGVPEPETYFVQMFSELCTQIEQNKDRIRLCYTAQDLAAANAERKTAAFLSLEGAEAIGCDPGRLEELKELGVTMTTLTWNDENALAGSHLAGGGLTKQGVEFVKRAQSLGILIDVSHLSEQAFWDICDISTAPIFASHSNSRACCENSRNLTDSQFKTICNFGGMVGVNLYAPFLNESGNADFSDVQRHLAHFLELGGQHHLALGGDLDGCDVLPGGFDGVDSYNALGRYLVSNGMDEQMILQIFNNNMVRFVLQNLRKKE